MSSREFAEWMAYYRRHPWGEERMDIRFAVLLAHLANLQRDPKKKPRPYKWQDFELKFGEETPKDTEPKPWEELMSIARQWLVASGGVDKRGIKH